MKNHIQSDWVQLDGAQGEGGGQVLRTALTLSMITGRPFRIERIRAGRNKPGLLRQHLTAVEAAAAVCGARVAGAVIGSQHLVFEPGPVRGGDYRFAIGTAGSCTLVLQTLLPALWFADAPSTLSVSGGTHNQAAPPADFLIQAWAPLMARMGVRQVLTLRRHGFYPAGGGEVTAEVVPVAQLLPLRLMDRGALRQVHAEAVIAAVAHAVARRELACVVEALPDATTAVRDVPAGEGPGNVLLIRVEHDALTEVFTGFGERGVSAERVAAGALQRVRRYLAGTAAVDEFLADQLLLPLALAGGGEFTVTQLSSHLTTQMETVVRFLPVAIEADAVAPGAVRLRVGLP
ncbi:RNA 3'-terminal phosphate cyclase [Chitiniphilus purpureus]|uniref:RNA 3'-terminal phosphate cyclase n=1 Tax=Chitiniphilus purpureus TaxID=2981137 RepID=A0ABY6DM85_9NEIS|nr:RNA 3'-terminal phosphate cyclase [Chitiniphilus sp. CD1]UXY15462.1 RNA 3'-terminal phosphate cyclase [Chitiniphilus sp. CD1]